MTVVEDKRAAILAATLRLVSQNGFHGTAMSKVAREAGVSAGIIYHYFDSKDTLMVEVYKDIKQKFGQVITENFDAEQPLRAQIRQLLGLTMRYYIARPLESAFVEQFTRSPYFSGDIENAVAEAYQPLLSTLQQAQQQMIIKDLPFFAISTLTLDVATSLAQKQAAGLLTLDAVLVEAIIDACWEALRR